jgi:hypothetical protein
MPTSRTCTHQHRGPLDGHIALAGQQDRRDSEVRPVSHVPAARTVTPRWSYAHSDTGAAAAGNAPFPTRPAGRSQTCAQLIPASAALLRSPPHPEHTPGGGSVSVRSGVTVGASPEPLCPGCPPGLRSGERSATSYPRAAWPSPRSSPSTAASRNSSDPSPAGFQKSARAAGLGHWRARPTATNLPRRRPQPRTHRASTNSRWSDQRVRTGRMKPLLTIGGRLLEPYN